MTAQAAITKPTQLPYKVHNQTLPPKPTESGYLVKNDVLERLGDGDIKRGRRTLRQMIMGAREPRRIKGPTEKPATVRIATIDDEQDAFDLLVLWHEEHAGTFAPLAPDKIAADIQKGTRLVDGKPLGIVALVDDDEGTPVGIIVLVLAQWSFSNQWFINEMYTFVHPDHRKSRHAEHLVQFAKWATDEWSRQFGYQMHLVISVLTQDHIAPKVRFFGRFLTFMGAGFMYPCPSAEG